MTAAEVERDQVVYLPQRDQEVTVLSVRPCPRNPGFVWLLCQDDVGRTFNNRTRRDAVVEAR